MADVESNINIDINTSDALSSLRLLQKEISNFHQVMSKTGAISGNNLKNMQQNLVNSINSTGQFTATLQRVTTTTESFTNALEKNKFSMGQYFKYAGASTQTFGRLFRNEFDTIEKVARERVKTLQTQYVKLGRDANGAMQAIAVRPQVLDMQDLGTKTAIAAQKAQLFNQLMKQGSTELLNFGKNTQWAGRQLMVGFTIPLGIMGAAAAKEFKAIEDQVIRLERVYGDFTTTVGDTEKITSQIKDLAGEFTKYGVAVSKTIGLAADAAAMGKTGADLVAQVAEANRLAVLGGVDQAQSLETTISMTNAFGVSAEKLAGKIDFLNAVENQTVTSIEDLTKAIPTAGPVVQQLGGNVEDLAFFMTAMKEGGIDAGEGANALKSGLASLINPTQEAIDQLNSFGINIQAIRDANAGDVAGMVKSLATELNGLSDLNRAQAIETMFGKFQFARMSTLFKNVIEEGSQANRVLDLTTASTAELAALSQKELSKIEASPLYKFQGAIENFKAALAPVGEEFMKAVTPLINFGTDILNKFNEMSDGGKQFVVILTGAVAGIGPVLLMTFGLIANGVANIIKGFMFLKNIFTGVGSSTNTLTSQLSYMTTEQMNANAVAVSLGQVHTNLIGTFNAEAASVRNLSAAYVSAIATQSQFMGPIVSGKGTKNVKKMASGGLVPGTGTGDTVPAMLTPGEFVLTKDVASSYPGLISAMMSGSIRAYAKGGLVSAHTQSALSTSDPEVMSQVLKAYPGFGNLTAEQQGMYQISGSLTADVGRKLNEGLKKMEGGIQGIVADQFLTAWDSVKGKFNTTATKAGVGQYTKVLSEIEDSIGKEAVRLAGAGGRVSDQILAKATENILNKKIKSGGDNKLVAEALMARRNTLGDVRSAPGKVSADQLRAGLASGELVLGSDNHIYHADKNGKPIPGTPPVGRNSASAGPKQSTKNIAGGYRSATTLATIVDPKNAMLGNEVDGQMADAESVRTDKKLTETKKKRIKVEQSVIETEGQSVKDAKKEKRDLRRDYAVNSAGKYYDPNTGKLLGAAEVKRRQENEARRARYAEKKQAKASMPQPASPAKSGGRAAGLVGKAGVIGMGVSGALAGAGMMGGPVGDVANSIAGPLFAVSGVFQMLTMFPGVMAAMAGPLGLVVAGVAGLGIGLYAMHQQLEETRKSAREAASTVSVGTTAINKYAEATGRITATEELKSRKAANTIPGAGPENTFGTGYLESEAGKTMQSGFKQAVDSMGTAQAIQQLGLQLGTAVASNVLTKVEATEVAAALGESLNNQQISVQLIGKLDSLLGANGENLLKEPVDVQSNLMSAASRNATKSLSTISGTGMAMWGSQEWNDMVAAEQQAGIEFASMRQQGQLFIDTLQLEHETRLENLKASGDLAGVEKENIEYQKQKLKLQDQLSKSTSQFLGQFKKLDFQNQNAILDSAKKSIEETFAGTDQEQSAKDVAGMIRDAKLGGAARLTLMTDIQAGNISPDEFKQLAKFINPNAVGSLATYNALAKISAEVGGPAAGQLTDLLNMFPDGAQDAAKNIVAKIAAQPTADAQKTIDFYTRASESGALNLVISANSGNSTALLQLADLQDQYNKIDALAANGPITFEAVVDADIQGFEELRDQAEWFNSQPPLQQKMFLDRYITIYETLKDGEVLASTAKTSGINPRVESIQKLNTEQMAAARAKLAATRAKAYIEAFNNALGSTLAGPAAGPGSSGGGGGSSSEPDLPTLAEQYQAALKLIGDQEEDINKKYEKRLEALDEIAKAQEAISEQQRDQLDIADALTKGDVAAAARAVQTSRQNAAKRALEQQRQALDAAKSAELANVTYNGYTRAWYEAQLKAIDASDNARIAAGQAKANGGLILGPGSGTSDSIPAMLSNGEYVIRAAAVRAIGVAQLERLNNIDRMGFAGGGKVASGRMLGLGKAKRFNTGGIGAPSFSNMSSAGIDTSSLAASAAPVMINNTTGGNSVYNYSVNVNAATNSDPNQIANSVMRQIRNVEQRRVRGNYING